MAWESGPVRAPPPQQRSRLRALPGDRRGQARGARHAGERRRDLVLPAARARPAARDRAAHARVERADGRRTTRQRLAGRRLEPAGSGPGPGEPRDHGGVDSRARAADRAARARDQRAGRPAARRDRARPDAGRAARRRPRFRSACRRRCSSGGPTCSRPSGCSSRANADVGAAKALFYPTISLTGAFGTVSGDLGNLLKGDSVIWSFGAGSVPADVQRASASSATTRRRRHGSIRRWRNTSRRRSTRTAKSPTRWSRSRSWRRSGRSRRRASWRSGTPRSCRATRYDDGLSTYLEVLIADQQLFQLELQLAQTRGEQLRAFAQLYRALGGGWQPEPPPQAAPAAPTTMPLPPPPPPKP